jgi:hypothetical protein
LRSEAPHLLVDKSSILKAYLIARGDVDSLEDRDGLRAWAHCLNDDAGQDVESMRLNFAYGHEKEGFAVLAARKKLAALASEGILETDEIRETGLTSCMAYRCGLTSSIAHA